MNKLAFIILMIFITFTAVAESTGNHPVNQPLRLTDGSYLFITTDGTMRMVNQSGKPFKMKDGVQMELEDGTTIRMKNKRTYRYYKRMW
jgi:hypothetical protein